MHEKRFNREIERLRDPERVARLEVPRVVSLCLEGLPKKLDVLDVGTGTGLFAEAFASQGAKVTGLDANPQMLPAAREHVPEGIFQEGVAENLPFEPGSFDLVFMGLLLHETDDPLMALQEAHRVGRKRLAILEWPDEEQAFGPPRDDRLSAATVNTLAQKAGFSNGNTVRLENLVLYRFDI